MTHLGGLMTQLEMHAFCRAHTKTWWSRACEADVNALVLILLLHLAGGGIRHSHYKSNRGGFWWATCC